MIRPAAAATNRLSWWSVINRITHNMAVTISQWRYVQFILQLKHHTSWSHSVVVWTLTTEVRVTRCSHLPILSVTTSDRNIVTTKCLVHCDFLCRWHVSRHKIVDDKENNFCLVGWSNFVAERRQLEQCVSRKWCKISLCPRPGDIKRWCCLTSDVCLSDVCRISGRRAACPADRLDGAYWLIGPGSAGLAQGCRCALPLQSWAGAYRGGRPHTTYSYRFTR